MGRTFSYDTEKKQSKTSLIIRTRFCSRLEAQQRPAAPQAPPQMPAAMKAKKAKATMNAMNAKKKSKASTKKASSGARNRQRSNSRKDGMKLRALKAWQRRCGVDDGCESAEECPISHDSDSDSVDRNHCPIPCCHRWQKMWSFISLNGERIIRAVRDEPVVYELTHHNKTMPKSAEWTPVNWTPISLSKSAAMPEVKTTKAMKAMPAMKTTKAMKAAMKPRGR